MGRPRQPPAAKRELACESCPHAEGWHLQRTGERRGPMVFDAPAKRVRHGDVCTFPGCSCAGWKPHHPTFAELRGETTR